MTIQRARAAKDFSQKGFVGSLTEQLRFRVCKFYVEGSTAEQFLF